jgi:type IV fimbrial biogenesis protein FimT
MNSMRTHRESATGFTVVELMVSLSVAAILTVIALPNLRTFVLNSRRDSLVDGLVASLHYARTQAIDMDQATYLCAGVGGVSGTAPPALPCVSGVWSSGWEVVTVPATSTSTQKLLATHSLSTASTTPGITAVNGNVYFKFSGNGTVTIPSGSSNELIVFCDSRGASYARAVEINTVGYIQSSSQTGEAPNGTTALTCPST